MLRNVWTELELKRWMQPDAHRYLRPDWRRFFKPGHENDPLYRSYERIERKYRPDQLRDDWGQFADEGGGGARNRVRVASSDKPTPGRSAAVAIFTEVAKRAIEAISI